MATESIEKLLTRIASTAGRSFDQAMALPPRAYFSEELLGAELERIFKRDWICIGHVSRLVRDGDYFTAQLVGTPVIALRDKENKIRILSNSCRHRGAQILAGAGRVNLLVCPYHGWSYDRSGLLLSAPGLPSHATDGCRLPELRHEIWHGWIFVSLDPDAPALEPRLQGLAELFAHYETERLQCLFTADEQWPVNWKMLVENFMESYHLAAVHKKTLNRTTPVSGVECWPGGVGYAYHTLKIRRDRKDQLPFDEERPAQIRDREVLSCIFPSNLISVTPRTAVSLTVQPAGVEQLKASFAFYVNPDYLESVGQTKSEAERELRKGFDAFNAEDKEIVSRLAEGLRSSLAKAGPLGPLERPLWEFHRYLATKLVDSFSS
ncbi:MAG TPA: aromatic ring-hydroxylating dioxygenase subunit alpha [Woeseiaceae bacterium]|nr:aromatic ring-hydroxylating dioxygenase subunit alpha [Woeseiaceae bacterium]